MKLAVYKNLLSYRLALDVEDERFREYDLELQKIIQNKEYYDAHEIRLIEEYQKNLELADLSDEDQVRSLAQEEQKRIFYEDVKRKREQSTYDYEHDLGCLLPPARNHQHGANGQGVAGRAKKGSQLIPGGAKKPLPATTGPRQSLITPSTNNVLTANNPVTGAGSSASDKSKSKETRPSGLTTAKQ